MPPKKAVSALARNKNRDGRLTREDWLRERKPTLRQRCALYGLSIIGKKDILIDRLTAYLQGENQPSNYSSIASDAGSDNNSDVNEPGNPPESFIITNPASPVQEPVTPAITTNQPVFEMPMEQLRILIREEVRLQQTLHRPSTFETQPTGQSSAPRPVGQLSPASCHSRNPEVQVPSSGHALFQQPTIPTSQPPIPNCENFPATSVSITATTGMSLSSIQLPPLSSNILKSIQNKEYIDFNNLLPASLYDYSANQATLNLQFNPYEMGNNTLALTSMGQKKVKINSVASWLQAWNLFIRAMVFYHPKLAPELLMYQEYICGLQRNYPLTSWLRYDAAFRLSMSQNKNDPTVTWSKINDYAFNQFIRCSPHQNTASPKQQCFKCFQEGHYANNCPSMNFRPSNIQQQQRSLLPDQPFRPINHMFTIPCRHYNNNNFCKNPQCSFPHRCNRCGGEHPGSTCRSSRATFQSFTTQKPNTA